MKKSILIVTLAALLAFFFFPGVASSQQEKSEKKPAMSPERDFPVRLKEALQLTPEQEAKLKDFRKICMEERQAFREQMKKMSTELRELMKDPKADQKKVDGLIDEMSKLRADRMKAGFRNRSEVKGIFTQEQLQKLEKFRGRLMQEQRFMGRGRFMGRPGFEPGIGARRFARPWQHPRGFRRFGMRHRPGFGMWWLWQENF